MIFFVGNDGTVISSVPSPVYQGAANANDIYVVAPFAANLSATVAFKLPNGVYTERYLMTPVNEISGVINEATGKTYAGWKFSLPNNITQYFGTVTAQFFFYSAEAGRVVATSSAAFTVGQGVPLIPPDAPSPDVYETILSNLSTLQQKINNGDVAARSIYAWNSTYTYGAGELVFYPDFGQYGVFLKSLADKNTTPPYTDGVLDTGKWLLVSDFNILTELYSLKGDIQQSAQEAAQNAAAAGQSAREAAQNAAAAGQSANAAANSSQEAAQSAQAAEDAAARIERQAEYIEGVRDGTVSVPKATSDGTGKNIAEQFAVVNSDIEGLREDINNEEHFRGVFLSVEALKAKYPTATENDYAYISGGNEWVFTDGAWTDSGNPSPDSLVPASTSIPLMDGEGSAGTSNSYAKGDHRHPTDTSRASAADLNDISERLDDFVDLSSNQTIEGGKTFKDTVSFDASVEFNTTTYWGVGYNHISGDAEGFVISTPQSVTIHCGGSEEDEIILDGETSVNGTLRADAVYDNGERVYSANNPPPATETAIRAWLDVVYPVGGNPYVQYPGTPTPAELFPNTSWEIDTTMQGRTIIGSGGGYTFGATGGNISHTHNISGLTAALTLYGSGKVVVASKSATWTGDYGVTTNGTGGNEASYESDGVQIIGELDYVSNMQPYTVINYWKRTA